jgi:hypothetical protein
MTSADRPNLTVITGGRPMVEIDTTQTLDRMIDMVNQVEEDLRDRAPWIAPSVVAACRIVEQQLRDLQRMDAAVKALGRDAEDAAPDTDEGS